MAKRILVAVPAAPSGVHPLTIQGIMALEWDGAIDYLILRNDQPDRPHYDDLALKLNTAREFALLGDYDAMLIIEADMIAPSHTLQRLMRVRGADIVYALYCSRRDHHQWLAFESINPEGGGEIIDRAQWGKVVKSAGAGTGCTLLHRKALEALLFRTEQHAPDWYLALDAAEAELRQKHDLGVVCGHIVNADPLRIVWPTEDGHRIDEPARDKRETLAAQATGGRYVARKAITFTQDNRTVRPGEIVELSAAQASMFLARGIVDPQQED